MKVSSAEDAQGFDCLGQKFGQTDWKSRPGRPHSTDPLKEMVESRFEVRTPYENPWSTAVPTLNVGKRSLGANLNPVHPRQRWRAESPNYLFYGSGMHMFWSRWKKSWKIFPKIWFLGVDFVRRELNGVP